MLEQNGTIIPLAGGFAFKIKVNGRDYYPFKVRTDGQIEVWFQYLRSPSLRAELAQRLGQIPGVAIPAERINGKPRFSISALIPSDSMLRFINVFSWLVTAVREGIDNEATAAEQPAVAEGNSASLGSPPG